MLRSAVDEGQLQVVVVLVGQRNSLSLGRRQQFGRPIQFRKQTCCNSMLYCFINSASTATSAGRRAGAATNSRAVLLNTRQGKEQAERERDDGTHPTSFLPSQRKGFSKL